MDSQPEVGRERGGVSVGLCVVDQLAGWHVSVWSVGQ